MTALIDGAQVGDVTTITSEDTFGWGGAFPNFALESSAQATISGDPNDYSDSSVGAGQADSGWNVESNFAWGGAFPNFALVASGQATINGDPNDYTDSSVRAGQADSGWNVESGFLWGGAFPNFALIEAGVKTACMERGSI